MTQQPLFPPQCPEKPSTFTAINNRRRVGEHFLQWLVGGGEDGRRKQELPVSPAEPPLPFYSVR